MDRTDANPRKTARAAEPLDAIVGARIAARRTALGLSQTALGELVGVSCQQVQKYEGGQNRISASRLHNLALALGLPVGAFFPERPEQAESVELSLMRSMAATPEGRAMATGFSRIEDRAVRQALTRLVEVLSRAA
ncbi:helix-turn-helix domain-containing protein [Brevundimonas sp.]|jgi:transcriptional regulator with XRE-family HTH domain|uniref:helix-turn-helix domain-containing protein n=1 Tax=Brevundimonas sp. TaxID=1871086 RepID=UPI0037BE6CFD